MNLFKRLRNLWFISGVKLDLRHPLVEREFLAQRFKKLIVPSKQATIIEPTLTDDIPTV
jgi:hypothetical protein